MKLKIKTLFVVGGTMFLFFTLLFIIIRPFYLDNSIELDRDYTIKDLKRIHNLLNSEMESFNRLNRDWAVWDDSYRFVEGNHPSFIDVNLQEETFKNNQLNFIIFINNRNEVIYQRGYNLQKQKDIDLSKQFYQVFLPVLQSYNNSTQIVPTDYGVAVTSIQSIFPSNEDGPSNGVLIMGRFINSSYLSKIGGNLSLPLSFNLVLTKNDLPQTSVLLLNDTKLKGSLFLKEYSNDAIMEFSFVKDRVFYLQRKSSFTVLISYIILISTFITILIIALMNKFILYRIKNLTSQLKLVEKQKDIRKRITINGKYNDELTYLEHSINNMLFSLEEKHSEVKKLAYYDQLTLLPNRHMLSNEFQNRISDYDGELAVLFFDLDGFKRINDSFGHKFGDTLLKIVCERVKPIIIGNGIMTRFGGDEFVILLKYRKLETLEKTIQKIITEVGKEFHIEPYKSFVTTSIGVSLYPKDSSSLERLLQLADIAMYEAKKKGKNQFVFFEDLTDDHLNLLELENDLKYALEREQFELYYQSIVCSENKEIVGLEALLRWNHPTKGMIPPNQFIPIAEEIGVMPAIGNWVLEQGIEQFMKWFKGNDQKLFLAVNVSKTQMKDDLFIEKLDVILNKSKFPPELLQIEITESDISLYLNEILKFTNELKKRKIKIALDDFGVGTSSLLFLKDLPIDVIKIDQNFIKNVPNQPFDTILLAGILDVIRGLQLDVVIEGIETEEQIQYVTSIIEAKLQGYYFSKPLPVRDVEAIISEFIMN